jgi:hypothetical protein
MISVSKRFLDRAKPALRRYQKVLAAAKRRDVNEADTVTIVTDFMSDVLGYDKYEDLTGELAVRCTFCDLAVRREGELQYLIEVKAIGRDLRENQLKQAVDYGANQGVEWVLLTNGAEWQAHRIRFEQPISSDLVFTANLIDDDTPPAELLERLYLISKEAGRNGEIDRYFKQREATSRYVIAQLLLAPPTVAFVRRQLRGLFEGVKIDEDAVERILRDEVLKRDVIEGDKAVEASKRVRRATRRRERVKAQDVAAADTASKADVRVTPPPKAPATGSATAEAR